MPSIVFDMDGVLIDSERIVMQAWAKAGTDRGLGELIGLFYQAVGRSHASTGRLFAERFGSSVDYEAFRSDVRRYYMELTQDGVPLKKGTMELLHWLKEKGWRIGLASSSRLANIQRTMDITGMGPYFHVLLGGDMLKASKPEPDIYLQACAALGVDPAETYAVEDSKNGILSASAAGMKALLVPDLIEPDDVMQAHSLAIFPDLLALRDWLMEKEAG